MQNPAVVCIACWRNNITIPSWILCKFIFFTPVFLIEWRICHNKICTKVFVQIICKSVGSLFPKITRNTTDSKIHFCHFIRCTCSFLAINRNIFCTSRMIFYKLQRLNEHTTRTTTWVIDFSLIWLNHFCNEIYYCFWSIEFTLTFSFLKSKLCKEVFIDTPHDVIFFVCCCLNIVNFIKKSCKFWNINSKTRIIVVWQSTF